MTSTFESMLSDLYIAQGLTLKEIAARLETSSESVRRALIEAGIPRRPRGSPIGKHLPAGGQTVDGDGYHLRLVPEHPYARGGYVLLHRLLMEAHLQRPLEPHEVVAHKSGDRGNNSLTNLQLYASMAEFARDTLKGNSHAKGDIGNAKRRVRRSRSPEQMMVELARLRDSLGRAIRRSDLAPPNPSYRAIARKFGTWQAGVAAALDRHQVEASGTSSDLALAPSAEAPTYRSLDAA